MKKICADKFDGDFITKTYFSKYSPTDINWGQCFHWAYCAYKVFHKCKIELWSTKVLGGHAFIKMNGKFYDSESPFGENTYQELACFKRGFKSNAMKQRLSEFEEYWEWNKFEDFDILFRELG